MMLHESIETVVSPSPIPCGNHQPLRMAVVLRKNSILAMGREYEHKSHGMI
jgi:hypothetical protein